MTFCADPTVRNAKRLLIFGLLILPTSTLAIGNFHGLLISKSPLVARSTTAYAKLEQQARQATNAIRSILQAQVFPCSRNRTCCRVHVLAETFNARFSICVSEATRWLHDWLRPDTSLASTYASRCRDPLRRPLFCWVALPSIGIPSTDGVGQTSIFSASQALLAGPGLLRLGNSERLFMS